jgi:hypothetical protein
MTVLAPSLDAVADSDGGLALVDSPTPVLLFPTHSLVSGVAPSKAVSGKV